MPEVNAERSSLSGTDDPVNSRRSRARWTVLALLEIGVVTVLVILDFFIPTLIILLLIAVSLTVRRQRLSTLGFHHSPRAVQMAATVLGLTAVWDLFQIGLTMPILNRVTGERQDLSQFAGLEGNLGSLLIFLALSWTVAAVGEEIVYRSYLPLRITDICGTNTVGILTGVVLSSVLFGVAHTEQGTIGVVVTFLDALFYSFLRWRFQNLWAAVLGHGFNNTIGLVTFYVVGPIYALW